ncbi:MAG: molybdopterin-dependent oxidoreductase [Chloroflexi bacterium]|nr:molybdopterin-dependent oxidoreductase [Chloroflexota bacterium]
MNRLNRRRFLRLTSTVGLGWLAAACGSGPAALPPTASAVPPSQPTREPARATARPTSPAALPLLRNANREGAYVRWYTPFPAPQREAWRLQVGGLVQAGRSFTFSEIQREMPVVVRDARMKCVECWSFRRQWGGFTYADLAAIVQPLPEAQHVTFRCADAYYETLSIAELAREGVLFVYQWNGEFIEDDYGAPLRLFIPWKYGYKMPKAIVELEFTAQVGRGYWSDVGPYTLNGDIEPGLDHPLDVAGGARNIQGGEITAY